MKMFVILRGDVTIANGVVFAAGATVVHSALRRDRDNLTRFASLADVQHYYRGCEIEFVPRNVVPACTCTLGQTRSSTVSEPS
ncbi:MAG: hypothetical protein RL701_2153 [Pseudomonadota bacterium]|jgi:hypothetical protein